MLCTSYEWNIEISKDQLATTSNNFTYKSFCPFLYDLLFSRDSHCYMTPSYTISTAVAKLETEMETFLVQS